MRAVLESLGLSAVALWVNILILRSFTHYTLPDGTWMPDPAHPQFVLTAPGRGYRFNAG